MMREKKPKRPYDYYTTENRIDSKTLKKKTIRRGHYYNEGVLTYDAFVKGEYYCTVQVNEKKLKDGADLRKLLFSRANSIYPGFQKIDPENVEFRPMRIERTNIKSLNKQ